LSAREIACADLMSAIDDLKRGGFRLDVIYPADGPKTAVMSRGEESVRLTEPDAPELPSGLPRFQPEFVLTRAGAAPGEGRAGMLYRDLIPGRLGGRIIASHINIPEGGPVSDWVHYHRVVLQLIFVRRGWVRVVYEDEGDPFVMGEGDLVLQPPLIRHRVLESSPGLEVVELSAPALHETFADHKLELPNVQRTGRKFGPQQFLRYVAAETPWTAFGGGEAREIGLGEATGGSAEGRVIRPTKAATISFAQHPGELVFGFVLDGSARLRFRGDHQLGPADAFVIPPNEAWSLAQCSDDFGLLHITTARLDDAVSSPL